MCEDLQLLLDRAKTEPDGLCFALEKMPCPLTSLPAEIINQLVELVPQMAQLLNNGMDNQHWAIHSNLCHVLAYLGPKAQSAIPALFDHAQKYPRFELNAWAIGHIGGPGVVRRLIQWTYWQGGDYDRKRTDSVCGAIRSLGESAIEELLEIANLDNDNAYERTRALLNLDHNTTYSRESVALLMGAELSRNPNCQCSEALANAMAEQGRKIPESVIAIVEPLLLTHPGAASHCVRILSELGVLAIPSLKKAIEQEIEVVRAISALVTIGGEGLEFVYHLMMTTTDFSIAINAIYAIPVRGERSFAALTDMIRCTDDSWAALRWTAIQRLGEFSDQHEKIREFLSLLRVDQDEILVRTARETLAGMMES